MDHYQVLGVRRDATEDQIKRAYRKIARDTHPDTHPDDPVAERRFKEATEAYEVLVDPSRRTVYDRERRPAVSLQDLLIRPVGARVVDSLIPHAPAARRDGAHQIVCLPEADGHVTFRDPRDPTQELTVPVPPVHRLVRVVEMGAAGTGGGSRGDLFILPLNHQEKP